MGIGVFAGLSHSNMTEADFEKMIITQIKEIAKKKSQIFLDEEPAFILYNNEIRKYKLICDQEIPESVYLEITNTLLPKRAKLRAMNLLQTKDYTRKQLKDKLLQGGYGEKIVEQALCYVESYHYIDDLRYAKSYISYRLETKSRRKLEQELFIKGVNFEIIQKAFEELSEEGQESDEISLINDLLIKKKYNFDHPETKEMQRMYGFLSRKGFSQDAIYKVLISKGKEVPFT